MRNQTRTMIVSAYLLSSAVGIAYAQSTFLSDAETYGKLFMLCVTILGVIFGAAGAWIGLGYKVKAASEKLEDVCEWQEAHDAYHREQNGEFRDKLDSILRKLDA